MDYGKEVKTVAEEKISCVKPAKGPTISESTNTPNEATILHAAKEENKMLAKVGKPAPDFEANAFVNSASKTSSLPVLICRPGQLLPAKFYLPGTPVRRRRQSKYG